MDNAILPKLFGMVVSIGLLLFLWNAVLPAAKEKLKKADQSTAKLFLFLASLPLVGLAFHYGSDLINALFNFTDSL
jgi:hypothetical protein